MTPISVSYTHLTKNSYPDTKSHWARKYIEEAVARGILVPSESTQLGPDQNILRSQAAAMIVRALQLETSGGTSIFTDRDDVERSLYSDEIKAAYDVGIISGFPDGSFAPYRAVSYTHLPRQRSGSTQTLRRPLVRTAKVAQGWRRINTFRPGCLIRS